MPETKPKANDTGITLNVNGSIIHLTKVEPKKAGKHKFDRYQPPAETKVIAPFSVVYIPK